MKRPRHGETPCKSDRNPLTWTLGFVLGLCLLSPAAAQPPEEFHNLEVLPEDIELRELLDVMKGFCRDLGVRCVHCHVGDEATQKLWDFDFVSDDKPAKQTARVMLRMTREINRTHLPEIGKPSPHLLEVQCGTCHRGQARPMSLEQTLEATVEEDGLEAGLQKYAELRERYYGSHTFDFSARPLERLARSLMEREQPEAAVAFVRLNLEHFPERSSSYLLLGDLELAGGDQASAITSFQKARELSPNDPRPQQRLEQLSSGPAER